MTPVLSVKNLKKTYPGFALEEVSFDLAPGAITGFMGRNGAGKTTTLKALLGFLRRDGGEVTLFGGDPDARRQEIGYISGGFQFYPGKKLKTITKVVSAFYDRWDEAAYRGYLQKFGLDETKTVSQLSAGMQVKYALCLALSHGAQLLILDEPTSGLDPMSREELLDIFLSLRARGVTILFSTHIISDLDRCADNILYLRQGRLAAEGSVDAFTAGYRLLTTAEKPADKGLLGVRQEKQGFSALVPEPLFEVYPAAKQTDLKTIILHLEREGTV